MSKLTEPVEIAKLWKSPRNKRHMIVVAFRQFEGHDFLDCRVFAINSEGQGKPTPKGLTVSLSRVAEFAAAVQKALLKAEELGLLDEEGEE